MLFYLKKYWEKRQRFLLLLIELIACFIILFFVVIIYLNKFSWYKNPIGFETNNVMAIEINRKNTKLDVNQRTLLRNYSFLVHDASMGTVFGQQRDRYATLTEFDFVKNLTDIDFVTNASYAMSIPFVHPPSTNEILEYLGRNSRFTFLGLNFNIDRTNNLSRYYSFEFDQQGPLILGIQSPQSLPWQPQTYGATPLFKKSNLRIANDAIAIEGFRYRGQYAAPMATMIYTFDERQQRKFVSNYYHLIIKVSEKPKDLKKKLLRALNKTAPQWHYRIIDLDQALVEANKKELRPIFFMLAAGAVIIAMVLMGFTSILWQEVQHRRMEIGLRIAVGALPKQIISMWLIEIMVITLFACFISLSMLIQLPLLIDELILWSEFVIAGIISLIAICFLTFLCGIHSALQAAKTAPIHSLRLLL